MPFQTCKYHGPLGPSSERGSKRSRSRSQSRAALARCRHIRKAFSVKKRSPSLWRPAHDFQSRLCCIEHVAKKKRSRKQDDRASPQHILESHVEARAIFQLRALRSTNKNPPTSWQHRAQSSELRAQSTPISTLLTGFATLVPRSGCAQFHLPD